MPAGGIHEELHVGTGPARQSQMVRSASCSAKALGPDVVRATDAAGDSVLHALTFIVPHSPGSRTAWA